MAEGHGEGKLLNSWCPRSREKNKSPKVKKSRYLRSCSQPTQTHPEVCFANLLSISQDNQVDNQQDPVPCLRINIKK